MLKGITDFPRKPSKIEKMILKLKKTKIKRYEESNCIVETKYKELNGNIYIMSMTFWRK
jgi:hypothetical protein